MIETGGQAGVRERRPTWIVVILASIMSFMLGILVMAPMLNDAAPATGKAANTARDSSQQTPTSVRGMTAYMTISADRLLADYRANEIAADRSYKDRVLLVTGVVDSIGRVGEKDTAYVDLLSGTVYHVQIQFDPSEEATLASLRKGNRVEIWGYCAGYKYSTVYLVLGLVSKTN